MKRRIVYRVSYANSEDFQRGIYHFSPPFIEPEQALEFESEINATGVYNTQVEKWYQVYERGAWEMDYSREKYVEVYNDGEFV